MQIDFPFVIDRLGSSARTGEAEHVRDMLEELLMTSPGERPNRPDFGTGIRELLFAPNSPELAATVELVARAAIDRWLGDVVAVQHLEVAAVESALTIDITYALRNAEAGSPPERAVFRIPFA